MTEKKERKERKVVYTNKDKEGCVSTFIGNKRGASEVFEIVWPVPTSDEAAEKHYGVTLSKLVELGVRNLTTKPNYQEVGFNTDGDLVENGHQIMQELADAYKVGQRKKKEKSPEQKELESLLLSKGMSLAELISKAKEM